MSLIIIYSMQFIGIIQSLPVPSGRKGKRYMELFDKIVVIASVFILLANSYNQNKLMSILSNIPYNVMIKL